MIARKGMAVDLDAPEYGGKEMNFTRAGDYSVVSFTSTFFALDNLREKD